MTRPPSSRLGTIAVTTAALVALGGCATVNPAPRSVVLVTNDDELAEAGALVADGGVILLEEGTYHGTLEVSTDDVTVRGVDRNAVILDGELSASSGVVATGERVTIENLTVRNYLQNGVLVTGVTDDSGAGVARGPDGYLPEDTPDPVPGYLVQYVTAQNNGLYGIYAFNRTGGTIRHNLATGGSDSGIYVGQCADCGALVESNVMQWNAVGLELANASNVTITGNRIVENRIGVTILSNYLEAHGPTDGTRIVGNVIADNNNPDTPEQATGAFGTGIGLAGTVDALVTANRISGNDNVGLRMQSSEDFALLDNAVRGNAWADNGLDIAFAPSSAALASGNCIEEPDATTAPPALACTDPVPVGSYDQPPAPRGIRFSDVPFPDERPGLDTVDDSPHEIPDAVDLPDVSGIPIPDADLLAAP